MQAQVGQRLQPFLGGPSRAFGPKVCGVTYADILAVSDVALQGLMGQTSMLSLGVCARAVVANCFFVTICVRSKSGRLLASADDNGLVKVRPGAVVVNDIFFNVVYVPILQRCTCVTCCCPALSLPCRCKLPEISRECGAQRSCDVRQASSHAYTHAFFFIFSATRLCFIPLTLLSLPGAFASLPPTSAFFDRRFPHRCHSNKL